MRAAVAPRRGKASFVATKTTIARDEDGKDQRLVAGRSFVYDAAHFLVLRYPELFRRTDGRPMAQRSRLTRQTARTPAGGTTRHRPLQLPKPPLIRRTGHPSGVTVELRDKAYLAMTDEAFRCRSETETGGGLFGYAYSPKTNLVVVREAFGPGPASRLRYGAATFDAAAIDRQADEYERDGVDKVLLGLWHSHVSPSDPGDPSDTDCETFAKGMRHRNLDHYIALILTPTWDRGYGEAARASWVRPTIHAWHMHHVGDDQFVVARAEVVRRER
jgi:hypothetical protein